MQGCDVTALRGFLVYRFPANFSSPWVDVHLVTFAMRCTHSGTKLPRAVDGRLPALGWAPLGTTLCGSYALIIEVSDGDEGTVAQVQPSPRPG